MLLPAMPVPVRSIAMQIVLLGILAAAAAGLTAVLHPRQPVWEADVLRPGEVRLDMVLELPEVLWVDARTRADFEQDHIPGAVLLNEEEWDTLLFDLFDAFTGNPERPIVVYCDGEQCQRSTKVAERLRAETGFDAIDIFVLKGGWSEWKQWNNR